MDQVAQVLYAGAAFFNSTETVSREQWRVFIASLGLASNLPGIQGVGYSLLIQPEQLAGHSEGIRAEGFPSYMVRPEGSRQIYSSIIYLEPFAKRNLQAFGYDMFSEPVRRAAMEAARDTGLAKLSGKVRLVQETEEVPQAGTLIFMPVYKHGMPTGTVPERRAALAGWVYSPYRMTDLMTWILGSWEAGNRDQKISLQIHDGTAVSDSSLLFDSASLSGAAARPPAIATRSSFVTFAGTDWSLSFSTPLGVTFATDNQGFWLILALGVLVSLFLFSIFHFVINTRNQALAIAERLTAELRSSEEKYRIIFDNELFSIFIFDRETLELIDVNGTFSRLYGYSREELVGGMTICDISAEPYAPPSAANEDHIFIPLRWHRKKDGTAFPVEIFEGPYSWQGRKVVFSLAHDIGKRLATEAELQRLSMENQTLLAELQHRVKNSFNMISSLVSLTTEEVESEEAQEALAELEGRVRSISQLYSLLYQSGSFSEVRLDTYCAEVISALSVFRGRIHFSAELDELPVQAPLALPIGLILTEVLTNCLKYAFPENRPGQILVSLRKTEVGAELTVRDTGIGLPADFSQESQEGMGMKLIMGLSRQIDGVFSITADESGTASVLVFPLEEVNRMLPSKGFAATG
ncbi:MAG: CHASE domain-containing protein [Spirochaetota bacterium]